MKLYGKYLDFLKVSENIIFTKLFHVCHYCALTGNRLGYRLG